MKDSSQDSTMQYSSRTNASSPVPESALKELNDGIAKIAIELTRIRELLENGASLAPKPPMNPQTEEPEMIALDIESFSKRKR